VDQRIASYPTGDSYISLQIIFVITRKSEKSCLSRRKATHCLRSTPNHHPKLGERCNAAGIVASGTAQQPRLPASTPGDPGSRQLVR
jgi:hypothetical protein